jgi:glutamine synthetase
LQPGSPEIDRDASLPPDTDVDPGSLSAEDLAARGIERLPRNLPEALTHYDHSDVLKEAFGLELHETIAAVRRAECEVFDGMTDDEIAAATRWRH